MSKSQSAQDVRTKYIAAMPAPLGEHFSNLFNSVAWLNSKWDDYRALFRSSPETIELMNTTAGAFFFGLSQMYWEVIVLHLCRLTDPPELGKYRNLSVRTIADLVPNTESPTFRASLDSAIGDCMSKTAFARVWRDKRFAHTDLPLPGGKVATPLPAIEESAVQEAIDSIGEAMNCFERHYLGGEVGYGLSIEAADGVLGLTHYLRKGLDAQRIEDSERRPWV
jgi:hypothetical protein